MLARNILVARWRRLPIRDKPLGKVAVTDFVEDIEGVDQQTLMVGRGIGNRVYVGRVFSIIPAFEAQRRIDGYRAWIER